MYGKCLFKLCCNHDVWLHRTLRYVDQSKLYTSTHQVTTFVSIYKKERNGSLIFVLFLKWFVLIFQVNMYIDQLVMSVHVDGVVAHTRCQTYMNACTSQPDPSTGTDKNFESAILGCTLDDQKRVKKRLQGLLEYFAKLNITTCSWVTNMLESKLVLQWRYFQLSFHI